MDKKVSIIMGIYNSEMTIKKAVDSIINQTYENWELIMCDDGSIDRTYEIAKVYSQIDNRIIVIKNERNMGLAHSLNRCICMSCGEYIARHDSDDYSKKDRIENEVKFLNKNVEYGFVSTSAYLFDNEEIWGERGFDSDYVPSKNDLCRCNQFIHPTVMIRRTALDIVSYYTVDKTTYRNEDYDLWFRLYAKNIKGYVLSEKLYYFREDLNSYSRKKFRYRIDEMKVRMNGYKIMNMEKRYYVYSLKPIIVGLIPIFILRKYHRGKGK